MNFAKCDFDISVLRLRGWLTRRSPGAAFGLRPRRSLDDEMNGRTVFDVLRRQRLGILEDLAGEYEAQLVRLGGELGQHQLLELREERKGVRTRRRRESGARGAEHLRGARRRPPRPAAGASPWGS